MTHDVPGPTRMNVTKSAGIPEKIETEEVGEVNTTKMKPERKALL